MQLRSEYHSNPHRSPQRSETMRAALGYASRGIPVFPCMPRGKEPLTTHGYLDASTDPRKIHAWWNANPGANIGIPTGKGSGLLVLDVDNGGTESLKALEGKHGELPATTTIKTGSGGLHHYFRYPAGSGIRNSTSKLGVGLDVRGEGGYVVAPPSVTEEPYEVLERLPLADPPKWLLLALRTPSRTQSDDTARDDGDRLRQPVSVEIAGPPIPEGKRNDELSRIAGRLHDGSRTLEALAADLQTINAARCTPPLDGAEVDKVARSIHARQPCKAAPQVMPGVLAAVDYLGAAAAQRPVRGMAGGSGWSIYSAGLELLCRYGREHSEGVALSVDVRTWAQAAGVSRSTVSRFIRRSPLVRVERRGSGRRASIVVFVVPSEGYKVGHSNHKGSILEDTNNRSVPASTLRRILYRLRWGPGRIGKTRAALLAAVVECSGSLTRAELATQLGRKPNALKVPLRWLVDAGLLVRIGRGRYAVPEDIAERLEEAREVGREPEADRLQIARHDRERAGYRDRHCVKTDHAPTHQEMRERRESYPQRRREAITAAVARLFAEHPEYRGLRVGQITCRLPRYLPPDFVPGPEGYPKDAEVEALLDGVAA